MLLSGKLTGVTVGTPMLKVSQEEARGSSGGAPEVGTEEQPPAAALPPLLTLAGRELEETLGQE